MQVNDMGGVINDLIAKQRRDSAAQRTFFATRKTAVQVATVRQVTRLLEKAENIDHRHRNQRTT